MQRMVPTSDSARGESSFPTVSTFPVGDPGLKTEEPLYASISTSFPATMAAPTSRLASFGCPMTGLVPDLGMKRTRPGIDELSQDMRASAKRNLRVNDGIDIFFFDRNGRQ